MLIDLYCGAGGAAKGYHRAGFEVIGVDINPQPNYPYDFIQADALDYLSYIVGVAALVPTVFHASPPCQHDSETQRIQGNDHPDLIAPTRALLEQTGRPYVIENVRGAVPKLRDPVMLCGAMFGLKTYRHRYFETSFSLPVPTHPEHIAKQAKMGRAPQPGEFIQCVGNFSSAAFGRAAMGTPWMTRDEMSECIPPVYTEHVGSYLMDELDNAAFKAVAA